MSEAYVHGYHSRENQRLQDQAGTLVDLLHVLQGGRGKELTANELEWTRRF
jgi:hypothetical protein